MDRPSQGSSERVETKLRRVRPGGLVVPLSPVGLIRHLRGFARRSNQIIAWPEGTLRRVGANAPSEVEYLLLALSGTDLFTPTVEVLERMDRGRTARQKCGGNLWKTHWHCVALLRTGNVRHGFADPLPVSDHVPPLASVQLKCQRGERDKAARRAARELRETAVDPPAVGLRYGGVKQGQRMDDRRVDRHGVLGRLIRLVHGEEVDVLNCHRCPFIPIVANAWLSLVNRSEAAERTVRLPPAVGTC